MEHSRGSQVEALQPLFEALAAASEALQAAAAAARAGAGVAAGTAEDAGTAAALTAGMESDGTGGEQQQPGQLPGGLQGACQQLLRLLGALLAAQAKVGPSCARAGMHLHCGLSLRVRGWQPDNSSPAKLVCAAGGQLVLHEASRPGMHLPGRPSRPWRGLAGPLGHTCTAAAQRGCLQAPGDDALSLAALEQFVPGWTGLLGAAQPQDLLALVHYCLRAPVRGLLQLLGSFRGALLEAVARCAAPAGATASVDWDALLLLAELCGSAAAQQVCPRCVSLHAARPCCSCWDVCLTDAAAARLAEQASGAPLLLWAMHSLSFKFGSVRLRLRLSLGCRTFFVSGAHQRCCQGSTPARS